MKENPKRAVELYEMGCERGNANSLTCLAYILIKG